MRLAMRAPMQVIVIDGNHDVSPRLVDYAQRPDVIEARAAGRPLHLGGTLWWADRASTWTWNRRRYGALGDAVSPDKFIAKLAPNRWPDHEAPTRDDLRRDQDLITQHRQHHLQLALRAPLGRCGHQHLLAPDPT